jgi:hypothetical protein
MSDGIEWYPADWVDEWCPPSKPSPDGFILREGNGFVLGYALGEKGVDDDDRGLFNGPLDPGAVVNFISCERFADVEVTLRHDGTFDMHGPMPAGEVSIMVDHDVDTLHESFEALIAALKEPGDDPFHIRHYIFDDAETEKRVTLQLARWSDSKPHLFEIVDSKPMFTLVPAVKQ